MQQKVKSLESATDKLLESPNKWNVSGEVSMKRYNYTILYFLVVLMVVSFAATLSGCEHKDARNSLESVTGFSTLDQSNLMFWSYVSIEFADYKALPEAASKSQGLAQALWQYSSSNTGGDRNTDVAVHTLFLKNHLFYVRRVETSPDFLPVAIGCCSADAVDWPTRPTYESFLFVQES